MLHFFLISVACFLGLLSGMLLSFIAPEELAPGKRHLWIFQSLILITLAVMFTGLNLFGLSGMIIAGSLVVLWIFFAHRHGLEPRFNQVVFIFSPLLLYFSYASQEALIVVGALIFLYGLPVASLFVLEHGKMIKRHKFKILLGILKDYGFFLVLSLVLAFFA